MSSSSAHSARSLAALASGFASLLLAQLACGTSEPTNPPPTLTAFSPSVILAGSAAATLTVSGSGFVPDSRVRWNGADRVTHYQSAQTLTVDLPASDLASVKFARLTVVNGPPGGGVSDTLSVPVGYPVPQITTISPAIVPMQSGSDYQSVNVTGTGFTSQSFALSGTTQYAVNYVSPTQLVVLIGKFTLGTPGTRPLAIFNLGPGGGTSNAVDFGVAYPVPTLAQASPDTALVGQAFPLTVTGTGFSTD